ncbi:PstS family phosphate ABC transporter substrate-binding protein [Mesobacillus harenae]|uniref:PstS family phosphate ABC transporter substrate-binding protein n=1 Tax=Mesobacillus harenae TaxID=2213203 RepID=UPI00158027BA|nr:substrate-binding domain-containing protein [Mesobacillus harenae]
MGKLTWQWILFFVVIPFILALGTFIIISAGFHDILLASVITLSVGGLVVGYKRASKRSSGKSLGMFLSLPLVYTAVLWAVFTVVSGGFNGDDVWLFYGIFHLPYAPIYMIASLMGDGRLFLWAPFAYELSFLLGGAILFLKRKEFPVLKFKQLIVIAAVFCLAVGTGAAVKWNRAKTVLPSYGFAYGGGYSSTDLTPYEVINPANKLPKLSEPPSFTIAHASEMPVLDGAEAAFPVYSAFANAVYENVGDVMMEQKEVVSFTNTIYAYERLLTGDADIYFGAEPSAEQRQMAEFQGKELVMTPIGKEAFVFFINPQNNIASLKVSEIQAIYSDKIKNWSEIGGADQNILAFQRPKNSGSQTLLEKIMGDTPIAAPLKEEVPAGMGGIIEQVADYRNYKNSIGFSFRFFATGMQENENIKLLAVEGIEPSPRNIKSEEYPFTASLYAITLKDNPNPTIDPFLNWMTGPQGQEIVEKIGYIPL